MATGQRTSVLFRILISAAWLASLGVSFLTGVFAYRHRNQIRSFLSGAARGGSVIPTNLYNIAVQMLPIPAEGRDGAIAVLDDGLLFANRFGAMWFVTAEKELQPLALRIPINFDEFEADPYNALTNSRDLFAVKDILVQTLRDGIRLSASYNYWYADQDCYALRVSSLEATTQQLRDGGDGLQGDWRTVFETQPCRPLTPNLDGIHRNPTLGAGGRLAALAADELLVTVGGFGPEQQTSQSLGIQGRDNSYGKTILVDLETGTSSIYSIGHRNPQGLALGPDGAIWLTEHAARGGDELNRILADRNYGFPLVSYGTEYESLVWSTNPRQGRHDGFEKPTYAWVPSVGISQLIVVEGTAFESWESDLLVGSMNAQTLFRVHLEDGHAVYVEPILVGHRIRDIAELPDGTIALKTDDNFLLYLRPIDASNLDDLSPAARGQVLAGACAGCHSLSPGGTDGIGPSLWGVVGREVASRPGFAYSTALTSLGGSWSSDRLRAYVADPSGVAPGTPMALTVTYRPEELDDLMTYLESLR